jgi:hypothetical protein
LSKKHVPKNVQVERCVVVNWKIAVECGVDSLCSKLSKPTRAPNREFAGVSSCVHRRFHLSRFSLTPTSVFLVVVAQPGFFAWWQCRRVEHRSESQTIPLLSDALPWGMRCRDGELEQVAELFEKQQSGRGVDGKLPVISVIAPMRHGKGAFFDVVANSRRFARALSPTDEAASQARCFITEFGLFFPSDKWQIYSVDSAFRELWFRILASAAHDVCRSNRKDDLLDRMMREVPNLNANAFNEILNYFFGRASPRIFIFHEIAIIHSSFRL